jgi:hypothetical protein
MKTKLIASAAACVAILSSCSMDYPKTRGEFTDHPKISRQTYTVSRSLDAVAASLDKQANRCVNGTITQNRVSGAGVSTSRDAYLMSVEKISAKRAELTYRQASNNMAFQPKGGFFMFAADLEAQGAKSTKVTLYHSPYLQGTLINAVTEWSKGNDSSCHGYGAPKDR